MKITTYNPLLFPGYTPNIIPDHDQYTYLIKNVLAAIAENRKLDISKIVLVPSPTGVGKTTSIVNWMLPALAEKNNNHLYLAPTVGVVSQTQTDFEEAHGGSTLFGKPVLIIGKEEAKQIISGHRKLPRGTINIWCLTHQFLLDNIENFIKYLGKVVWTVYIDEAHKRTGTTCTEDTKDNTGVVNNTSMFHTYKALTRILHLNRDNIMIGYTATPTVGQEGKTEAGEEAFTILPEMPKTWKTSNFVDFFPLPLSDNDEFLKTSLWKFKEHCLAIAKLRDTDIDHVTWNMMNTMQSSKIIEAAPDMLIQLGRENATNGIRYDDVINDIESFARRNKMVVADLVRMTYDGVSYHNGEKLKTVNSIQNIINDPINALTSHIIVAKDKITEGVNIPLLTHAVISRIPSQDYVHNNWSQLLGRLTRRPFRYENHETAKAFVLGLDIHYDQKVAALKYYAHMTSNCNIVPEESNLLSGTERTLNELVRPTVIEFCSRNTKTLRDGMTFLLDGAKESCRGTSGIGKLNQEQVKFVKESFCEACPRDSFGLPSCLTNVYEAYCKTYEWISLDEFMSHSGGSALTREHKNGNHGDNRDENIAYVCSTLSGFKTDIHKDWNQRYEVVDGKKVTKTK